MTYELGEVSGAMQKDLTDKLYKLAKNARSDRNLDEFWIIITHKEDKLLCNIIREGIVISNRKPERPLINSMCFHVIWSKGIIEPLWILPRDIPIDDEFLVDGAVDKQIFNQAAYLGGAAFA